MKVEKFLLEYHDLIASDYGEGDFSVLKMMCPGLASPKMGKLLNRAVRHMPEDEIYCEIGTFLGYSLISASLHNVSKKCLGIDNFRLLGDNSTDEKKDWARKRLQLNLEHFKYGNQHVIDADFRKVQLSDEAKIGVFFIDGHHSKQEVVDCFEWGHKRLSDEALIFVDDISKWKVGDGIKQWLNTNGEEYKEIFHMDSFYPGGDFSSDNVNNVFWNGLSILVFGRKK